MVYLIYVLKVTKEASLCMYFSNLAVVTFKGSAMIKTFLTLVKVSLQDCSPVSPFVVGRVYVLHFAYLIALLIAAILFSFFAVLGDNIKTYIAAIIYQRRPITTRANLEETTLSLLSRCVRLQLRYARGVTTSTQSNLPYVCHAFIPLKTCTVASKAMSVVQSCVTPVVAVQFLFEDTCVWHWFAEGS